MRVDSVSALVSALAGTPLENRPVVMLPILDTGECAYAVEIVGKEVESAWRVARGLVGETGRWPLVVMSWSGREQTGWENQLRSEDLFSRFMYEQASSTTGQDVSPAAILRAADSVDVSAFLDTMAAGRDRLWKLEQALQYELDTTEWLCGSAPRRSEVQVARLGVRPVSTHHDLDRWLLEWERTHGARPEPEDARTPWFDLGLSRASLLFMPTSNSWDSLAYIHWYGMARGAEPYIALGRQWSRRFGAELVANFGTMLQCLVTSPPETIDDAWELARQHDLIAPCTLALPGIRLRHYAVGLLGCDRWFLHERP